MKTATNKINAMINLVYCDQASPSMSTCVYVGFEAETSLNIAARIRGPNVSFSPTFTCLFSSWISKMHSLACIDAYIYLFICC